VDACVAAINQFAVTLYAHLLGAKAIFANIESVIALAFLTQYPTAALAAVGLTEKRLAAFPAYQGYSGKKPVAVLLVRLGQRCPDPGQWGDTRASFDRLDAVAALAGITPIAMESGKQRGVSFRWACNKRLHVAIKTFAANSRVSSS
jgi:hypothetical protein